MLAVDDHAMTRRTFLRLGLWLARDQHRPGRVGCCTGSNKQVELMLQASLDFAEADVHARFLRTATVEAERVLSALNTAMESDADLLTAEEAEVIGKVISDLKAAIGETDHRAIQDLTETLDKVSGGFAHRRMERALKAGLKDIEIDALQEELHSTEKTEE